MNWMLFLLMLIIPMAFSSQSLQKGQVIKQSFSYSISESLGSESRDSESLGLQPLAILNTRLPCSPPRVWVEEPPIFHALAAMGLRIFPDQPALIPLLSFLLLSIGIFLIHRSLNHSSAPFFNLEKKHASQRRLALMTVLSAYCPIFLRYSIQHLPDLLATAFLTLGVATLLENRRVLAGVFFLLAVTTKALTGFAVAPVLFWYFFLKSGAFPSSFNRSSLRLCLNQILKWSVSLLCLAAPFLIWLWVLQNKSISNPFFVDPMQKWVENRHSGNLSLLLNIHYYLRTFTWIGIKGVGLILLAPAIYAMLRTCSSRSHPDPALSKQSGLFYCWIAGLIPYWLLVRQGNWIHDYYSLPFAVPLAVVGVREGIRVGDQVMHTLKTRWISRWVFWGFMATHLMIGISSLTRMKTIPLGIGQTRPMYCEMEVWR